jgi:hypothetical protein
MKTSKTCFSEEIVDRIVKSHLDAFASEKSLESLTESKLFEHFSNFSVVSKFYPAAFDTNLVTTDDEECGIDGVAYIIDGELVTTDDEAKDIFLRPKRNIDVVIIFTQAKTSEGFDRAGIVKFSDAVADFLRETPNLPMDSILGEAHEIFNTVLKNVGKVSDGKPDCHAFYVTTGNYRAEREIDASFQNMARMLVDTGLFLKSSVTPVGKNDLIQLWTATWGKVSATLNVKGYLPFPKISGITEAYMVIISARTLIDELLSDNDGNLRTYIFDENVRAFLGEDNAINGQIINTITSEQSRDKFAILNNGITIISPDVRVQSDSVYVENFQIVNGCQTSNVLYHNKDNITDSVYLTAKIIEVEDSDLVGEVIKATNSQTKVDEVQFLSLKPIVRNVESFFKAFGETSGEDIKLYFERRARQYVGMGIPSLRIFDIKEASRAVASMFLERPDLAARYPTQMFHVLSDVLFSENNREIAYYTASLALYRLQLLISNRRLPTNFRKYKWHLLLCLKHVITREASPSLNNHKIDKYCQRIIDICRDLTEDNIKYFLDAAEVITAVGDVDRDKLKTSSYIADLKRVIYST